MDIEFWIIVIVSAILGGIGGDLAVKWFAKKGWIKLNEAKKDKGE
ncbi:hypothetical protein [Gracilimonas tropica]|nr:hypothetical protein [Gracilimonas tropica]